MIRRPPRSPLFPYPPLSRSLVDVQIGDEIAAQNFDPVVDLAEPEPRASQQHLAPVREPFGERVGKAHDLRDRKSTRLNSSHDQISYAVFCLKKKKKIIPITQLAKAAKACGTSPRKAGIESAQRADVSLCEYNYVFSATRARVLPRTELALQA